MHKTKFESSFPHKWEHKRCMLRIQRLRNDLMKRHYWKKSGDHKVIEIFSDTRQDKINIALFMPVGQSSHGKNITL